MAAQLRVVRRRIRTVQSTQKITRAFELISASRVVRAQQRVEASRPYTNQVTQALTIPTIGIGAGPSCDAQVLVWQDMAGLRGGPLPRFVKQYADLRGVLQGAVATFADEVRTGTYPGPEHSYS